MILVKDQISYTNPDGEILIGQVVHKSEQDVLECNLLYPTKTKQPGEKFFVNADDKMIKQADIKRQKYDKHKSQYSFDKESMEIVKTEENILKLGMKKLASLDRKYSDLPMPDAYYRGENVGKPDMTNLRPDSYWLKKNIGLRFINVLKPYIQKATDLMMKSTTAENMDINNYIELIDDLKRELETFK